MWSSPTKGRDVMMKLMQAAVAVVFSFAVTSVFAEEAKDYHLQAETPKQSQDQFKLNPTDYPHGIYVAAAGGWSTTYPKAAAVIQEKLKARGFIVTNKIEEADLGINFWSLGIPLDAIEEQSNSASGETVAANIGSAIMTGGISIIASGMSLTGKQTGLAQLGGAPIKGPLKLSGRGRITSEEGPTKSGFEEVKYSADDKNPAVYAKLFNLLVDEWIKEYTVDGSQEKVSTIQVK